MTRDELAKALQHRLDQMPHSLGFVLIPRDWLQEAVALLAIPARDQASRDDGDREREIEQARQDVFTRYGNAARFAHPAERERSYDPQFRAALDALITAVRASSPRHAQQEDQDQSRSVRASSPREKP